MKCALYQVPRELSVSGTLAQVWKFRGIPSLQESHSCFGIQPALRAECNMFSIPRPGHSRENSSGPGLSTPVAWGFAPVARAYSAMRHRPIKMGYQVSIQIPCVGSNCWDRSLNHQVIAGLPEAQVAAILIAQVVKLTDANSPDGICCCT